MLFCDNVFELILRRSRFSRRLIVWLVVSLVVVPTRGDGPQDNIPENVRPVPPQGIELDPSDQTEIVASLESLESKIRSLRESDLPRTSGHLPDVEIFSRAVRQAVEYRELFAAGDVPKAKRLLAEGHRRADSLADAKTPWTTQTGLVVRGFRSRIDDTVQPYGLVIPESYPFSGQQKHRLDIWLHGRGERSTETQFIDERMNRIGRIAPNDTIVVHPFGRYSNAFKFAGEIDVLEALEHARRCYRVDPQRIAIRGFSMGGAGCWQLAVHYPSLFFAANPGAGFSETPEFLKSFQKETLQPTWFEQKLWRMYDCTGYAGNLLNLPTVAYSGELDIQKQAADMMEQAMRDQRLRLTHLIGPQTKHDIHPESLKTIEQKLTSLSIEGRDRLPEVIDFTTYTLRYNQSFWVTITGLEEHWERANVRAAIIPERNTILLTPRNVRSLRLEMPAGTSPFKPQSPVQIAIGFSSDADPRSDVSRGRRPLIAERPESDRSWTCNLIHTDEGWQIGDVDESILVKKHGLQGPIDDAFMDRFIVVTPSAVSDNAAVDAWAKDEMRHFVSQWRQQFRGDAIVKRDADVTPEDIQTSNLILFGDPQSNSVIGEIVDRLPLEWNAEEIKIGVESFPAQHHAPAMIYPNPVNPERYVVLNSGFTYREYAYLNNARQVPKLPDWAIIDIRSPADSLWPGKIVAADFFDELWRVKTLVSSAVER
ncbi:MAG: prolyl oligopeptidase family serine peptidase [Pirellulaceae bacterium]